MKLLQPREWPSPAGTLLLVGCALAAVGLARDPQGNTNQNQTVSIPQITGGATADSNGRMIAVTGVDVTGASILYLVDTLKLRLVVYQASGGSESSQGVRFVGARRIDLDLELDGFNDKSEFPYKKLKEEFSKKGLLKATEPSPGAAAVDEQ
jgi:hypothetical protein